jgi:hypothetical protein
LNGHAPDGSDAEIQAPSVPTIAPPIGAGPIESEGRNPFLPPGPGREIADQGRSGGEEARSDRRRVARGSDPIGRERPGLFGMMFGRLAGRPSPRSTGQPGPVAPALDLDPSDPAAPEALKRQLERMIVQQEADRLSSVELLVVGPRVHIRAEAARPWQRMALRRGLERLPMPPGYHSTVEVR